jgi:hypothetical protein
MFWLRSRWGTISPTFMRLVACGLRLNVVLIAQLGWVPHPPIISTANIVTIKPTKTNANPLTQLMLPILTFLEARNLNSEIPTFDHTAILSRETPDFIDSI